MKKNIWKRLISLVLTLVLVVGVLPMTAHAWNLGSGDYKDSATNIKIGYKNMKHDGEPTNGSTFYNFRMTRTGPNSFRVNTDDVWTAVGIYDEKVTNRTEFTFSGFNCTTDYYQEIPQSAGAFTWIMVVSREATPHTLTTQTTPATCMAEGSRFESCSICGYKNTVTLNIDENAHVWGPWSYDETNHKRVCTLNAEHIDEGPHEGHDATCQKQANCDSCQQPYGDPLPHSYEYSWPRRDTINERCVNGCDHNLNAVLRPRADADYTFTGSWVEPYEMFYPEGWGSTMRPKINYDDNLFVGDGATCNVIFDFRSTGNGRIVLDQDFELIPAKIIITPDSGKSMIFGQEIPELTYTYNITTNQTPAFAGKLGLSSTEAGEQTITLGDLRLVDSYFGFYAENYTLVLDETPVTVAINKATASLVVEDQTVTYDAKPLTLEDLTYTYTGDSTLVVKWYADNNGEQGDEISAPTNAGTYWIGVAAPEGNYEAIEEVIASVTIQKAPLTIAANAHTITYGDALPENGVTYTGFKGNETENVLDGELTCTVDYEQYGDAGTYNITPFGLTSDNYDITFVDSTLTVNPKVITITADAKTKTYGDADPELTYVLSENALVNGDPLIGALSRAEGENAGIYAIEQGTLTAGGNYTINYTGANLTINTKAITVTIANKTSVYGEEIVELTATDDGIVSGDTDVYALETEATNTSNVGKYDITGTALDDNYVITFEGGEAAYEITKATAVAADSPAAISGLIYNESLQTLIDAGSTSDGTLVYSHERDGDYTAVLPAAEDAGIYHIWYKVIGDGNHTDSTPTFIEVKIAKADSGIGTVTAGVVTNTVETAAIVLTRANTDVDGNLTVDAGQTLAVGDNEIRYTFTPVDTVNYTTVTGTVNVTVEDTIAPTGTVSIETNSWADFLNNITFGLFFKETQTVSVSASDNLSDTAKIKIEYIEAKTAMDLKTVEDLEQWTEMKNGSVKVTREDTKQFVYYIRLTDEAGNVAYLSTNGAEYDTTAPVIAGVYNGLIYYTTQAVTVTDKNIDTITLNGEAATGSITLEGNKEATYTIVATDKAGNSATVTINMAPIADIVSSMEGKTAVNVNSDDKANLQAIVDTATELLTDEDTTAEEKAALEQAKADAEALIKVIEDTAAEQKTVTDKAAQFDKDTVKSTDKAELDKLAEDVEALLDTNNLTQDERTALETILEQVEGMIDTIDETAADIKAAADAIDALDPETVKSTDKAAIKKALATIENLLDSDHLTKYERDALINIKADAKALLNAIDEAAKATDTESIAKIENVTVNNVSPDDKSDLEKAKADLEKTLEDNRGNYTEEEKKAIQDEIDRINNALKVIENVETVEDAISDLPATVEPDDEETVAKIEDAKKAYDELTEYEKSLVDADAKAKLDKLTAAIVAYDIVKSDGSSWTKGGTSGLSFTANGPLGKFSGIEIDGKVIDAKYYNAVAGSTVITLKASYLETLSVGEHTIAVVYTDGEAEGTFKIDAKSDTSATGDDFNIMLFGSMFTMSLAAIVVLLLASKKRKQENA